MKKLTLFFTDLINRFLPDAFVFAILLAFLVLGAGALFGNGPMWQQIQNFGNGLWTLNNFAMQMALILITGSALAKTQFITDLLAKLALLASSPERASLLVTLVALVASTLNWGLGLIVGALMATEVAKKLKSCNYALLLASAYSGFLVWHGGLSGSIPLKLTDPTGIFTSITPGPIPLSESIFGTLNISIFFANCLVVFVVNYYLARVFGREIDSSQLLETRIEIPIKQEVRGSGNSTLAKGLEQSKALVLALALLLGSYFIKSLLDGNGLNLDLIIVLFFTLSLLLSGSVNKFIQNFNTSVKDASGILLQFPIYAAIMAVMSQSGIANMLSQFFVSISSEKTFLLFTYISAGVLNFFVPSGGGQWAIQGPIMLPAAKSLGVDLTSTAMAIAWGDAWTNMIQPFWALPLLSMAGVKLQKLISYTVLIFLASGLVTGLIFLWWGING